MPYTPTPEQELQFTNWNLRTGPLYQGAVAPLAINVGSPSNATGAIGSGGSFIKSKAFIIAEGPPIARDTTKLQPAWRIDGVSLDFEYFGVSGGSSGTGALNILLAKLAHNQGVYAPVAPGTPLLQVSDPYTVPSSTAGPAVTAATGKTLSRLRLSTTADAGGDYIGKTHAVFDLTQNIAATTTANSVTTSENDFTLNPGERLVAIIIPTLGTGADTGISGSLSGLAFNVRLSTERR